MPHTEMMKMPKPKLNFHIRVLDDKTLLLEGNNEKGDSFEYAYEDVDELLNDLRDDLGGKKEKKEVEPEKKEASDVVSKITRSKKDEEE